MKRLTVVTAGVLMMTGWLTPTRADARKISFPHPSIHISVPRIVVKTAQGVSKVFGKEIPAAAVKLEGNIAHVVVHLEHAILDVKDDFKVGDGEGS